MVGRKRKVPFEDVLKKLIEHKDEIIVDNKVVEPSNGIWLAIQVSLENKSTPKAIYNDALRWYAEQNKEKRGSDEGDGDIPGISIEMSESDSVESDVNSENEKPRHADINFTVSLTNEIWKTIQPMPTEHRRKDKSHKTNIRVYHKLAPGVWTNVLIDRIAQHRVNIPCTFAFKRCKVYENGKQYIVVSAKCTTCKALLIGEVTSKPNENDDFVKFKFTVRDFDAEIHKTNHKNVRVGGSTANEIFSSSKKASVLKRDLTKKSNAKMFEQDKGRTVTENAIRCGQSRRRQNQKISTDPVTSLQLMKASNAYGSMIHCLAVDPFFVFYASKNQFMLFDAYKKKNKYTKITCDATGSIVHKLSM